MSTTTILGLLNGTALGDIPDHTAWNLVTNSEELLCKALCEVLGPGVFGATQWNGAIVGGALSVDVSAGYGIIGDSGSRMPAITTATIRVTGLTDATTNYVFKGRSSLGMSADFTTNTTGTAPANTHLVLSCVTSGGAVTSINNNPTGRTNLALPLLAASVLTADANTVGGVTYTHRIDVAAGATGNVDVTLTEKSRVIDVWLVKKNAAGGGTGTITVQNGGSAITDAMSINVADKTVVRAGTIDDAQHEIAAGGTLRAARTRTSSTDETCVVYVRTIRVS